MKDSGERLTFDSGMVRDVTEGKTDYTLVLDGPMFDRWAEHLTRGAEKYSPRNWTLAEGDAEYERFRQSAFRHFLQWMRGEPDGYDEDTGEPIFEDHAAAVFFNINGAEYVDSRVGLIDEFVFDRVFPSDMADYCDCGGSPCCKPEAVSDVKCELSSFADSAVCSVCAEAGACLGSARLSRPFPFWADSNPEDGGW